MPCMKYKNRSEHLVYETGKGSEEDMEFSISTKMQNYVVDVAIKLRRNSLNCIKQ